MQRTLVENILSSFKHLESQQDSAMKLEKKAVDDTNKLHDISSEVAQEKEAKNQEELDLVASKSHIQELEDVLRNAVKERDC